ncbi:hypothetical protein CYQ64_05610 [Enterococcus faecium]|nr:hypothetical protein CYQ64_05610 [Enterococcus faecium]
MQSLPFDMIELNRSFKTKEEAIRYCGQMLVEAGCVDEEYIDAMVDRDKMLPVVLVNFNILKNISKFLQNVVVLDLIEHCKPVICFQIYSLAL